MRRGIGRLRAGGSGFSPAQIASTLWLDPSDIASMSQDSAGATPVTASGQPVGRIMDKSGNGLHFTASGAARPTYTVSGGYAYLDFSGSNGMASASTALFAK